MALQNVTLSPSSSSASGDYRETHLAWFRCKWATFCNPLERCPTKRWKHRVASIQHSAFVYHEDLSHQSFDLRFLEVRQSPGPIYSKFSVPNVNFSKWVSSRPITWLEVQASTTLLSVEKVREEISLNIDISLPRNTQYRPSSFNLQYSSAFLYVAFISLDP